MDEKWESISRAGSACTKLLRASKIALVLNDLGAVIYDEGDNCYEFSLLEVSK